MYRFFERFIAIISLSASAFASGVGSAALPGDLGNLGLFAKKNLEIWERAYLFADAIGAEEFVSFRSHDQIAAEIWAPGRISLLDHSHQIWGNIHYGSFEETAPGFNTQNGLRFPIQNGEWLPRSIETKSVQYGISDIWEGWGKRVDLAPGNWRDVEIRYPSSLRLSSGVYNFRKLKLTDYVAVTYDVSNGPIIVNVEEDLEIRQTVRHEFFPTVQPFSLRWYTNQSGDLNFAGFDNIHYGIVTAPNAKVKIGQRVNFVGAIRARSISVEPDGMVCVPPVLKDLRHSEIAMGPWFDPWTAEYSAVVREGIDTLHFEAKAPVGASVSFSENDFAPLGEKIVVVTVTDPARATELPGCAQSHYRVRVVTSNQPQLFVKESSPCSGSACDGKSWETALHSLQAGLDSAYATGREIWLAEGLYSPEREYIPGNASTLSFHLGSGADLRGGFEGTESSLDDRSGMIYRNVLLRGGDGRRTVTITGGSPTIDGVIVEQGGLWVHSGDPEFSESILRHSSGEFGGIAKIESGASLSLKGSFVHDGVAQQGGGVAWVAEGGAFRADNSLFFANRSHQGAQFIDGLGDISLDYSTSWSPVGECINASSLSSSHTVVWGEGSCGVSATSLSLAHSNFKGLPAGEGNLAAEPIFANAAAPFGEDNILGSLDDGLIPKEGSPLIDGGAAMPENGDPVYDILAMERPLDGNGDGVELPDIGAYEYVPIAAEIVAGRYVDGEFVARPKMPVFHFKWKYQVIDYLSGKDHTVLRIPVPKRKDVHKVSSAYAYIQFLSPVDDKPLSDRKFKVTFYKVKMDEKEYFVSQKPDGTGLALAFVDDLELEGVYEKYSFENGFYVPDPSGEILGIAIYAIAGASFHYEVPHDQFN